MAAENARRHFKLLIILIKLTSVYTFGNGKHRLLNFIVYLCKILFILWLMQISISYILYNQDYYARLQVVFIVISQILVICDFLLNANCRYLCLNKSINLLQQVNNLLKIINSSTSKNKSFTSFYLDFSVSIKSIFTSAFVLHTISAVFNYTQNSSGYEENRCLIIYLVMTHASLTLGEVFMGSLMNYVQSKYCIINNLLSEMSESESGENECLVHIATCYGLLHDVLEEINNTMGLFVIAKWSIAYLSLIAYPYEAIATGNYLCRTLPWMIINFMGLLGHLTCEEFIRIEVRLALKIWEL